MAQRAGLYFLIPVVLLALLQLPGCANKPGTFNAVRLTPNKAQVIAENTTVQITASVLNDSAGMGVTFTLSAGAVGTITQTSATTATYRAPAVITTGATDIVTATSVDFPKSSSMLSITVEPPPVITTTSLPTATLNAAYSAPVTATGGIPPFTWTIASGTLPAGLSLAASNTSTVNIAGTPTAQGSETITVTVTDAAGETNTSQPLTIVISTLAITTTSPLSAGTVNTIYPAVQFAATGGTGADTWSVASGSTLPAGLTLSSTGLLSGTPTAAGNYTFGITVTDSGTPPAMITANFTLIVSVPQNLALLMGSYAFEFSGYNSTGFVAFAGSLTADGNGNISSGVEDFNSLSGGPQNFTSMTGTYTLGIDGRGTITFVGSTQGPFNPVPTYAFSIDASGSGHGRFIEFDATGTRGSGRIDAQSVTTCVVSGTNTNTYSGSFAFGGSGFAGAAATTAGPLAFAGVFTATPPISPATQGSLAQAEMDTNAPNQLTLDDHTSVSGVYQSGPDASHCTLNLTSAALETQTYSVYPISGANAFLIETDSTSSATTPYLAVGEMIQQQEAGGTFPSDALNGLMAGGLNGSVLSGSTYLPDVSLIQIVPQTGSGSFAMSFIDNEAGTVTSTNGIPLAVTYSSDTLGRVATNITVNNDFAPVFYLIGPDEAFCVGMLENAPIFGELLPQFQPQNGFTIGSIDGTYVLGSARPVVSAETDISGFLTFDGNGNIVGTQDLSATAGNIQAQQVTGTYSLTSSGAIDGSGTFTLTPPAPALAVDGAFFIVTPTKLVTITTTPGDTNPVFTIVGH